MLERYLVKNTETSELSYQYIDSEFINELLEVGEEYLNYTKPSNEEVTAFMNQKQQKQYLQEINSLKESVKKNILNYYNDFVKFNIINHVTIPVDPLSETHYKEALEMYHNFEVKKQRESIDLLTYTMKYKDPISGEYVEGKYSQILEIIGKILDARRFAKNNIDFHQRKIDKILAKDEDNNIQYQETIDAINAYDYEKDENGNYLIKIADVLLHQ